MSISNQAMTSTANPPLAYTKEAIRGHLQHHATNGPAYVQIQATKALARMIGLYDEAKDAVGRTKDAALDKTKSKFHGLKFTGFGAYKKAVDEAKAAEEQQQDEDDEAAKQEDDDVP